MPVSISAREVRVIAAHLVTRDTFILVNFFFPQLPHTMTWTPCAPQLAQFGHARLIFELKGNAVTKP
jgi:hypothetical protein